MTNALNRGPGDVFTERACLRNALATLQQHTESLKQQRDAAIEQWALTTAQLADAEARLRVMQRLVESLRAQAVTPDEASARVLNPHLSTGGLH